MNKLTIPEYEALLDTLEKAIIAITSKPTGCDHKWCYQGTVYWYAENPIPGSGAYSRIYGDRYFCEHCLETRITNERQVGDSYENPLAGTLPK